MLNTEEMGKRIKELRIEKGWTGIKMSTRIGIDQSYYSKIEKGKHEIKLEKLYEIANILDVSLDYLTGRTNRKEIVKWPNYHSNLQRLLKTLYLSNYL